MQRFLQTLLLLGLIQSALSAPAQDLYHTTVCAKANTTRIWQQNLELGWQKVLIRISGNRYINENEAIRGAPNAAEQALDHFQYTKAPDTCPSNKPYLLHLHFKPSYTTAFLRQRGEAIWGASRPPLFVWIKIIGADADYLDAQHPLAQALQTRAQARGIALRFAQMDNQDQITPIANADHQTYLNERYHTAHQLIGTLDMVEQTANWTLVEPQAHISWHHDGITSTTHGVNQGVEHAIDTLASHYAVDQNKATQSELVIAVHPVRSLKEAQTLYHHLSRMHLVNQVTTQRLDGQSMELKITLQGPQQRLMDQLLHDTHLRLDPYRLEHNQITYTWQP